VQFPIYLDFWRQHPDVLSRTPLLQEYPFSVDYVLPSGRKVTLKGRWDSVDIIEECNSRVVYLQENKTKGEVDVEKIKVQLGWDLQTMIYLVALNDLQDLTGGPPLGGVRYNVVRRPLSGGKGSIVRHKARGQTPEETEDHYYDVRLRDIISEDPSSFFWRGKVEVSSSDLARFQKETLDPLLEDLCEWYYFAAKCRERPFDNPRHWRTPYGVYQPLMEGGSTEYDEFLRTGSTAGLVSCETVFPELEGGD
jgi:hypothetical protein